MAIFSFKVRHEHVRKFINFCFQRFRQKEIQKKKLMEVLQIFGRFTNTSTQETIKNNHKGIHRCILSLPPATHITFLRRLFLNYILLLIIRFVLFMLKKVTSRHRV